MELAFTQNTFSRHKNRLPFLHESGFAVFYGLVVGAVLRFVGPSRAITSLRVRPAETSDPTSMSGNLPKLRVPDRLLISFNNTFTGDVIIDVMIYVQCRFLTSVFTIVCDFQSSILTCILAILAYVNLTCIFDYKRHKQCDQMA